MNRRKTVIGIVGPYTGNTTYEVFKNIEIARHTAEKVWSAGFSCFCPHLNTAFMDGIHGISAEAWYDGTLELMTRCDAILVLGRWEGSTGTKHEIEIAKQLKMPVYFRLNDVIIGFVNDEIKRRNPSE